MPMLKAYKITDGNGCTRYSTHWRLGEWRTKIEANEPMLCTSSVFHAFTHPVLAMLLWPGYVDFTRIRLFECECDGLVVTEPANIKLGSTCMRVTRELETPTYTAKQMLQLWLGVALLVYDKGDTEYKQSIAEVRLLNQDKCPDFNRRVRTDDEFQMWWALATHQKPSKYEIARLATNALSRLRMMGKSDKLDKLLYAVFGTPKPLKG